MINNILYTLSTIFSAMIIKKTDGEIKEMGQRVIMCGWKGIWGRGEDRKMILMKIFVKLEKIKIWAYFII